METSSKSLEPTLVNEKDGFTAGLDEGMKDLPEVKETGPEGIDFAAEEGKEGIYEELLSVDDGKSTFTKTVNNEIEVNEFTKELLKNKPKYSPEPKEWIENGGKVTIDQNGVWTYYDRERHSVSYHNGYPDFKSAGMVKQEVKIKGFQGYNKDFPEADRIAQKRGQPREIGSTWHHHEDTETLQEINRLLHDRFRHVGGMSCAGIK